MAVNKTSEEFIRIQDFWEIFISKWYWYLLSLLISLMIAVFYLLRTSPIYTRTASILVKNDINNSAAAGMTEFSELGIFRSGVNIYNEQFTLKSPVLMTEVVTRLGLNERYLVQQGLKQVELYQSSPVNVLFEDTKSKTGISFTIRLASKTSFTISDFDDEGHTLSGMFGKSMDTPFGRIILSATAYFTDNYVGEEIRYMKGDVQPVAGAYAGSLQVSLNDEETTIIHLSISDASIQKAEDILNTLIDVYNEKWIQDKNQISVSTSQFINDRLGVIESELGNVDDNISSFKSENLIPDVQAASSIYMSQSVENKRTLLSLNAQLSTAEYIRKELATKSIDQPLPANSGIAGNNIESQISEYNASVLDRNRLIANSSEKNPLVQDLAATLQSMKTTIIQSVDNLIMSLNTQIKSTQQQQYAATGQLASNPNRAKYLLSVERQQKVKEALYLYLLQKREENELSQAFTAYNTRVITPPKGSNLPTAPRRGSILMVAFAAGLLIPSVLIFLKETLNTKVRGRKDLQLLSAPIVGEIPYTTMGNRRWLRKKGLKNEVVVVQEGNRNIVNEAFRVLRSNLDFMTGKDRTSNVLLLTSFNPSSGKSFLTINIAISFALKGKKILIIDGDLRHASLSTYIGSPKIGLSDYLNGQITDWREIVVADKQYADLHCIPVGTVPPNPTELLEGKELGQLLESVRSSYDYVFVDCPPIDVVADTQIIEKSTDRTLFIIRAGLLDRSMLFELESYCQEKRFKNLSVILNGTEGSSNRYGYRYGYHYGYHSYYHS